MSTSEQPYTMFTMTGPVSVEPVSGVPSSLYCVLLLGLTGVGKSSFIECLSPDNQLDIAKDQLEGATQEITVYRMNNVKRSTYDVYLVDTPGFGDRRISELNVINKIFKWMEKNGLRYFDRILYLDRITDTRVGGRKGRIFDMFKCFTGGESAQITTIVTTMWDRIWNESQRAKAEQRLLELRGEKHWKDFVHKGSDVVKFENTYESAMGILNGSMRRSTPNYFDFEKIRQENRPMQEAPYALILYNTLRDRLSDSQQRYRLSQDDLTREEARKSSRDMELIVFLRKARDESKAEVKELEAEVEAFGPPPGSVISHKTSPISEEAAHNPDPERADSPSNITPTSPPADTSAPTGGRLSLDSRLQAARHVPAAISPERPRSLRAEKNVFSKLRSFFKNPFGGPK